MMKMIPDPLLPPDFFQITNWKKPWEGAVPKWLSIRVINGNAYCHPSLLEKLGLMPTT